MKGTGVLLMAAFASSIASAADFSGNWKLENVFNGKVGVIHCTLIQAGNMLSGSCRPDVPGMEAASLAGTVKDQTAKWGYDLQFNGKPARVDYEVALAPDGSLSGSLLRNGSGSPIRGLRQAR
jgi:hypothetical protein